MSMPTVGSEVSPRVTLRCHLVSMPTVGSEVSPRVTLRCHLVSMPTVGSGVPPLSAEQTLLGRRRASFVRVCRSFACVACRLVVNVAGDDRRVVAGVVLREVAVAVCCFATRSWGRLAVSIVFLVVTGAWV